MTYPGNTARSWGRIALLLTAVLLLTACAAGPGGQWATPDAEAAGFWAGLWHGALLVVTLVVSFFTEDVRIYEWNNSGVAYDIGFVLGVLAVYGGGTRVSVCRSRRATRTEKDDLERRVTAKVSAWIDDDADEWKDLGDQVQRKIKAKLRRWLEEDDGST